MSGHHIRTATFLFVLTAAWSLAAGQQAPPALMVKLRDTSQPLKLTKVDAEVRIFGYLAETKMTMVFANPRNRVLEGELYFPLPPGATVSGYALDIDGVMVDGVAVEKHRAREVFEAEVRKGVDPGLVEYVKGNNFRARIFPIPANGTRRIRVEYVSEILQTDQGAALVLPLNFKRPVDLTLRVEVAKAAAQPVVRQGELANFSFATWRDGYAAETTLAGVSATKDLVIALGDVEKQNVLVEKADDGEYYFVIYDHPAVPRQAAAAEPPRKVTIIYDASGSRAASDRKRELAVVKALFERWSAGLSPENRLGCFVELIVFRNTTSVPIPLTLDGYDPKELLKALEQIQYDGGSQAPQMAWAEWFPDGDRPKADLTLLLTDGLFNFASQAPTGLEGPLYVLASGPSVNTPLLRRLAAQHGGQYFNLALADIEQVVGGMAMAALTFKTARAVGGSATASTAAGADAAEMYPAGGECVRGRFTLVGKLHTELAEITPIYDFAGKTRMDTTFTVSRSAAAEGQMLRRFWAQKRLEELMLFPELNRDQIITLGKSYGLVTPYTSLLVLERLEQYVEYHVRPPKSLPQMQAEYDKRIDTIEAQKKQDKEKQIERVAELWRKRTGWWEKPFDYPKDFRYPTSRPAERAGDDVRRLAEQMRQADQRIAQAEQAVVSAREELRAAKARAAAAQPADPELLGQLRQAEEKLQQAIEEFARARQAALELRQVVDLATSGMPAAPPGERAAAFLTVPAAEARAEGIKKQALSRQVGGPAIVVKQWDPKTPYLDDLKAAPPQQAFDAYMAHRVKYGNSPAFFLDCAEFFFKANRSDLGLQVLSNIAELELENVALLRVLGHRLAQAGELDLAIQVFEEVLKLRPEEPQSYRDLALVLARRADLKAAAGGQRTLLQLPTTQPADWPPKPPPQWTEETEARLLEQAREQAAPDEGTMAWARADYAWALELLNDVIMRKWARFDEIELAALMEANALLPRAKAAGLADADVPLDGRLVKLLDCDIRIVLTWDADLTDMDLHVIEPSGERVYYQHNLSTIGGLISKDFTDGYGPEEYLVHRAMNGLYRIEVNYFGSSAPKLLGAVTIQVDIFTNFARPNEQRKSITRRLTEKKEVIEVGQVEF